jgi:radical SAM superfamily enzyme YgiQ (UPF0313 family)
MNETFLYTPASSHPDAVRYALVYPYTYAVSMSSLGYLSLFQQLDSTPEATVTRINTDNMSAESFNTIELAGFSFSFELDILEVLRILKTTGVALYSADRDEATPLIFAGGPVVMTNPEPYADFFDFFVIGEGEDILEDITIAIKSLRSVTSRAQKLVALAKMVPGLYVPSLYHFSYADTGEITAIESRVEGIPSLIEKRLASNMQNVVLSTPILTPDTIFANTLLVEVMRGCAHRCRFCLASYSMLPARGPDLEPLIAAIEKGFAYTQKIGLLGALIADHPQFEELCHFLNRHDNLQLSSASLRADTLTPLIANTFYKGGQKNVTLAIETGSESLRKRINKHLSTEAILTASKTLSEAGIPGLKLYGMVGLPDETPQDLDETVTLLKAVKKAAPSLRISLGCSTFVPKASTPFQWLRREDTKTLQKKQEFLRKSLVKTCDFRPSSPKWDYVQALFSRGDRRLSQFIEVFASQGANHGALNRTIKQLKACNTLPDLDWFALRERPQHEILPWELLFLGVSKAVLFKESGL